MNKINIVASLLIASIFVGCSNGENETKVIKKANTDTYLGSRVNAIDLAHKAVDKSNKKKQEQDKLIENINN